MRGHGRLCRKVFYFLIFGIAHLLILYAMTDSVGRLQVFICGSDFSAPLSCAVGKTAQVVRRVLSRAPKERAATVRSRSFCADCLFAGNFPCGLLVSVS